MKTLILYHTKTGHTLEAIAPFVEAMDSAGGEATVIPARDFKSEVLADYDALLVGTPCWGGSSGLYGVATPIVKALKSIPEDGLKNIRCGGIVVHAKYGGKTTLKTLDRLLAAKGCDHFMPGPIAKAGTLASIFKGKSVTKEDQEKIKTYARGFFVRVS